MSIRKALVACSFIIFSGAAAASAVLPLDTFPSDEDDIGGPYSVFTAFLFHEIAIPFHLPAHGYVTKIETQLYITEGLTPLYVGIAGSNLVGATMPSFIFIEPVCEIPAGDFCSDPQHRPIRYLDSYEFYSWTGRQFLEAGDYWLTATADPVYHDSLFSSWNSNLSLLSEDWAERGGLGPGEDVPWTLVNGRRPVPIARITFQPGRRVSEPQTLALVSLGLVGLATLRRRRSA